MPDFFHSLRRCPLRMRVGGRDIRGQRCVHGHVGAEGDLALDSQTSWSMPRTLRKSRTGRARKRRTNLRSPSTWNEQSSRTHAGWGCPPHGLQAFRMRAVHFRWISPRTARCLVPRWQAEPRWTWQLVNKEEREQPARCDRWLQSQRPRPEIESLPTGIRTGLALRGLA